MTNWLPVPVPAIVPEGPQLSLRKSAVQPHDLADQRIQDIDAETLRSLPQDLQLELSARASTGPAGREAWTRGFTWAPENRYPAEARAACDYSTIDAPALPAPQGLATTPSLTGGTLTAATYTYEITAVRGTGETTPGTAVTAVVTGVSGSVALSWDVEGDLRYRVYGRVAGSLGLLATVGPFDPEGTAPTYIDTGASTPGAAAPTQNTTGGPGYYSNQAIQVCIPWVLVAEDSCSTFGFDQRDFKGRATRLLDNGQDYGLENEFWTGTLAQAQGWPNQYLTQITNDLTPSGGCSVQRGQQILQDYLRTTGFGGRGMIHCEASTMPGLIYATVNPGDEQIRDLLGNHIVAGSGYPGTGPGGSTPASGKTWMYATPLVAVRVEDDTTVFPETFAEATDWGQAGQPNTIRFRAMKFGAAYCDALTGTGAIGAAVEVTLAT
jgi:hypothetical protein